MQGGQRCRRADGVRRKERGMLSTGGKFWPFLSGRPIAIAILILTAASLIFTVSRMIRDKMEGKVINEEE